MTRRSWPPVNLDESAQQEPHRAGALVPGLPASTSTVRTKCLLFKLPVCDILLRQPELTETDPLDDHFRFVVTYLNGIFKWNHHESFCALSALPVLWAFQWDRPAPHLTLSVCICSDYRLLPLHTFLFLVFPIHSRQLPASGQALFAEGPRGPLFPFTDCLSRL